MILLHFGESHRIFPGNHMKRSQFLQLTLALVFSVSSLHAAEPDFTIEPGKRVGAVKRTSTLEDLKKAYGAKNVKQAELPGPEGSTISGAVIFEGGDREMHVIWNDEKIGKEAFNVDLVGKAWVIGGKLKLGATIADVEALNGGAFKVGGFDWDMGGYANFEGGKLENKVMVRFYPEGESHESLSGDKQIASTNKTLLKAKPVVTELSVILD